MSVSYHELTHNFHAEERRSYDQAKVQLYALGVGLGMNPRDEDQLAFVRDENLTVLPSFATVAAWDVAHTRELGMEWAKLIHVSQRLHLSAPLPPAAQIIVSMRCKAAFDKPDRNATLLVNEVRMMDANEGTELAHLENTYLARDFRIADAPTGKPDALPAPPTPAPDLEIEIPTSPQAALIYRLLGGRAPIHIDPRIARAEGFSGPIMHGLSTFGHICHAILKGACDYQADRLRSLAADFRAPVYPGETLSTRLWFDGETIHFETRVRERDVIVIANGLAVRA
jgi:acyl dehydratase